MSIVIYVVVPSYLHLWLPSVPSCNPMWMSPLLGSPTVLSPLCNPRLSLSVVRGCISAIAVEYGMEMPSYELVLATLCLSMCRLQLWKGETAQSLFQQQGSKLQKGILQCWHTCTASGYRACEVSAVSPASLPSAPSVHCGHVPWLPWEVWFWHRYHKLKQQYCSWPVRLYKPNH